jgi:hypothetical protein
VQSSEEKMAWGDFALELGTADALTLTALRPAALGRDSRFHHLEPAQIEPIGDLLLQIAIARLRLTSEVDWHVRHELQELVERAAPFADPLSVRALAELAVERGIHEALQWIG